MLNYKMSLLLLVVASCFFFQAYGVEELVVLHAPASINFMSSDPVQSSYLADIFSAMFGYSIHSNIDWHSLAAVLPSKRPEAIVVLELLGFNSNVDMPLEGTRFLLENAGDVGNQFDLLSYRTEERFLGKRPVLLNMHMSGELHNSKVVQPYLLKGISASPEERLQKAIDDPELGEVIRVSTFNISSPNDVELLTELASVKELLAALRSHKTDLYDKIPDVFWLKVSGLEPVVAAYGTDSFQFREALRLLRQMISDVEVTMRNIYNDNVVIAVLKVDNIPSPMAYKVKNRKLLESTTTQAVPLPEDDYNLALKWDVNFPVAFFIILLVVIVFTLATLGVSVAMWHMDPGRDSMVYRATQQRLKKD